jgi:hypothetical protein
VSTRLPSSADRRPSHDDERIAEVKLLFSQQGCKMFAPRRLGSGKDLSQPETWVVRYVGNDVYGIYGAVDAYGTGRTPLHATGDAWANFQAEQRLAHDGRLLHRGLGRRPTNTSTSQSNSRSAQSAQ